MGAIKGIGLVVLVTLCIIPLTRGGNCITRNESPRIAMKLEVNETTSCGNDAAPYFSLIYFHEAEHYIGSSNSVYRVNPDFELEPVVCIEPDLEGVVITCDVISKSEKVPFVCENQISLIENFENDSWLICGSNAKNPACWMCNSSSETWNCNIKREKFGPTAFVPKIPAYDSIWLYNRSSGLTFAATQVGYHDMPFFSRLNGDLTSPDFLKQIVHTNPHHENWLNTPAFVGKPIERDGYIYFFFRETATEYKNAGKIVYPRVGRVCADNSGTGKIDQLDDHFQTFVKARLNCSIDLSFPFYFNEIQDIYYDADNPEIVYAVFTTPSEGPPASAVCAYSMAEIANLFDNIGRYKGQRLDGADWLPRDFNDLGSDVRFGQCGHKYPVQVREALDDYNLIDQLVPNLRNVKATGLGSGRLRDSDSPLLYYNNYRFSSIVKVDEGDDNDRIVLMIGTNNLRILKAEFNATMEKDEYGSIVTEIVLDAQENETRSNEVRDMVVFQEGNDTYVIATAVSDVFKLRIHFCDVYKTCEECLRIKDPHCRWTVQKGCTYNGSLVNKHDSVDICPIFRDSEIVDQVRNFGPAQRFSGNKNHNLTYYSLLVAKKGSNLHVDLENLDHNKWSSTVSNGATENTEYTSVRLTLKEGETPENVTISVSTDNVWENITLDAAVMLDFSELVSNSIIANEIFRYDSQLARYEYDVVQIRQEILETCSKSSLANVFTCPGFRFQEDNDSFTCPA